MDIDLPLEDIIKKQGSSKGAKGKDPKGKGRGQKAKARAAAGTSCTTCHALKVKVSASTIITLERAKVERLRLVQKAHGMPEPHIRLVRAHRVCSNGAGGRGAVGAGIDRR